MNFWQRVNSSFDRFLFASCDPIICSVHRVVLGLLLVIYSMAWLPDAALWFSDAGVLKSVTAEALHNDNYKSLYMLLPQTPEVAFGAVTLLLFQSILLLLGVASRFQAFCVFVLLSMLQYRNVTIVDGQDAVVRWLVFCTIFMPVDHKWSLLRQFRGGPPSQATAANAWGLRLVQFELTAIYFSTAIIKLMGPTWRDGTALYYVARMDDVFGRFPLPDSLFETAWTLKPITLIVLIVELLLPVALWIPRLRLIAVLAAFALHLAIEYAMNIFLFEWFMIAGLISFLRPSDFRATSFNR